MKHYHFSNENLTESPISDLEIMAEMGLDPSPGMEMANALMRLSSGCFYCMDPIAERIFELYD